VSTRELVMMVGQLVAVISAHRNPASSRAMATGDDVAAGLACATSAGRKVDEVGDLACCGAAWQMGDCWPSGVALRGGGFKPPRAAFG
jgi:hypothetical protein